MENFVLKLVSGFRDHAVVEVDLMEKCNLYSGIEADISADRYVLSDQPYYAELCGNDVEVIENIEFLVNGFPVSQSIANGRITFHDARFPRTMIFMDSFGYVQICVQINIDGITKSYYSKYISVLVKQEATSQSVQRMAEFVYKYHEPFLRGKRMSSCYRKGIKEDAPQVLDTKIKLLNHLLEQYEKNYGYFRTGSKSKVKLEGRLVDFERAQYFDSSSIMGILRNPTYLSPVTNNTGIRYQKSNYLPTKVYSKTGEITFNIYENQVVVGFLKTLQSDVSSLLAEISKRLEHFPTAKQTISGYFASAGFIYDVTRHHLEEYKEALQRAGSKISELYVLYQNLLKVSDVKIDSPPRPSAIFLNIHHYRVIYEAIIEWFRYGVYDFAKEDFMLPFIQMHKLYECYVLVKILRFFESTGFEILNRTHYSYEDHLEYDDPENYNTFYLDNQNLKITIYYEPTVRDGAHVGENKLGIFRNTSIPVPKQWQIESVNKGGTGEATPGKFYCPDYIVKIERNNKTEYIILDAKFSKFGTVRNIYFPALAYKYLFSLSTSEEEGCIKGLCLIHGKSNDEIDTIYDVYDLACNVPTITPFAKILTLTENAIENEDNQCKLLAELFGI